MSVQVSYKKQLVLGLLLFFSLLIVLEFGARSYDYFNPYCSLKSDTTVYSEMSYWEKAEICDSWLSLVWHWEDKTNVYTLEPNQHKPTVNINDYGFRGPEISQIKQDDTYRIFVVGGSTTMSLRAPSDEQTHPGFLQESFNDSEFDFSIEIINAGIPSFTSSQELSVVENKIVNFEPNLIIVYDGTNDLNLPYGHTPAKTSFRSTITDGFNRYLPFWETVPVTYHIFNNFGNDEKSFSFDSSTTELKVTLWKENLEKICKIGNEKDFDVIILLQPILGSGNKKLTEYEQKQFILFEHEKVLKSYEKFSNELIHLEDHCTQVLDFRNIFDYYDNEIYFDNAHVKYQANEIIAENIFNVTYPIVKNFNK
jgi:lysophospholipase L1-like esterase